MRLALLTLLACALSAGAVSNVARAQSDARQRQAAAEAYDQGTAAYLSEDFAKAAEWFETAHRMAPAPAALIQAARAHEKAGNLPRAATLGLRLTVDYPDDQAAPIGQGIIDQYAGQLVRVDVMCAEECSLDLDGSLQEFHSFYLEPDTTHAVVASFETGERSADVSGSAGETKTLEFSAPPPPEPDPIDPGNGDDPPPTVVQVDTSGKPLPPIVTYVGAGLTGALLIGSVISTLDTNSSADEYEKAANAWLECTEDCDPLFDEAKELLDEGESKETLTTVLWVATGVAAAGTAVAALFLTDWSSGEAADDDVALRIAPDPRGRGAFAVVEGRF